MAEEKNKKPFAVRLIFGLFKAVALLVMLVIVGAIGAGIFINVKYNVNVLSLIGQVSSLNKDTGEKQLVTNAFDEEDYESYLAKEAVLTVNPVTRFTDKEIGAKLAKLLETSTKVSLAFGNNDTKSLKAEVVQVLFKNIPEQPSDSLADINVVIHIDLTKFKDENFGKFPQSMFKNLIPNELFVSCTSKVVVADNEKGYQIESNTLSVNALDEEQTENIFKLINVFNPNFGTSSEIASSLGESVVNAILGEDGLIGILKEEGIKDYIFEETQTSNNLVVYTAETSLVKTITYVNTKGANNSANVEEYTIKYNTIKLKDISVDGYSFDGWYIIGEDLEETKVTTLDANQMEDFVVYAKWSLVDYTITLNLNGGEMSEATTITYTIETETFTLPKPTKTVAGVVLEFNGWIGTGVEEITNTVKIEKGSFGDKTFNAYYIGESVIVSVYIDGVFNQTLIKNIGDKLNEETFIDFASIGMSGYSVDEWYTNAEQTTAFNFENVLLNNVTLYGTTQYIVELLLFPEYLSKFEAAQSTRSLAVKSRRELTAYIDYVLFYGITNDVTITLDYDFESNQDELDEALNTCITKNNQREGYSYYPGTLGSNKVLFRASSTTFLQSPTLVADQTKEYTYSQQDYGLKISSNGTRTEETVFNIDKISKTVEVSTSSQLVFALESGYKPICETGSAAESVYNKAKEILLDICDDSMSEIAKLKAIYEWIILNTEYDNYAAKYITSNAKTYDSWAAEGVFNSGKAVCEGFAKALIIMARIEGIPAIYVTGNGHAWNRVYVGGAWYVIDATHGNPLNNTMEIETVSYSEFLITDAEKANRGYSSTAYSEFAATTTYNYYQDYKDLTVDSSVELAKILNDSKTYEATISSTYYTVDVYVLKENASRFGNWMMSAKAATGVNLYNSYLPSADKDGNYYYTLLIIK